MGNLRPMKAQAEEVKGRDSCSKELAKKRSMTVCVIIARTMKREDSSAVSPT